MFTPKIIHSLPGRARIYIEELKRNPELGNILEKYLLSKNGVKKVNCNLITGNILIYYEPDISFMEEIIYCDMNIILKKIVFFIQFKKN